jgi:glycosyltransferase involved in cell wall biosynthesis
LNVAFLTPNKGQADLIEAFAIAFKGNKDVRLKIGGDGISMSTLIEKAEELGVSDQVVFMGMLSRDEVLREMQLCDCFVLSSHYETFGVVLVEALACGKPVVATACGGPECIVNEKNGYLVPVKDIHALAKTMLKIKSQIFSSNEISKECQECFGEESVVAKIKEVYGEVFRGRS